MIHTIAHTADLPPCFSAGTTSNVNSGASEELKTVMLAEVFHE